jgi:hypothetical protein
VLAIVFNHVFLTGTMQSAYKWWTSLVQTNKTWANFQDMCTHVHETYESLTAQAGGCHEANMAQAGHCNAASNTQTELCYTKTADAFTNLAMAAAADKDLITTLVTTNVALTGQLATKDRLIANL